MSVAFNFFHDTTLSIPPRNIFLIFRGIIATEREVVRNELKIYSATGYMIN